MGGSTRSRSRFVAVGLTLLVLVTGTNLPSPLWALYQHRFGFGPVGTTVAFACYALALVPAVLLAGPLADCLGPRRVVAPALLAAGLGCAVLAAARSLSWLVAGRVVQGIAVGACSGALTASLLATQPRADHRRAALLATVATTAGAGAGPILAGALTTYAPHPTSLSYLLEIALLAVIGALGVPALPAAPTPRPRYRPRRPALPAGRVAFTTAAGYSALTWAVAYVMLALAPAYVADILHTHNRLLTAGPAGLLLLTAALTQLLLAELPPPLALRAGSCVLLVGASGLILLGALPSTTLLLGVLVVIGIGHGLTFMAALRQATATATPGEHASVAAAFFSITYLGGSVPVIAVGLLATALPLTIAVELFAAVIGFLLLGVLLRNCPHGRW